MRSKLVLLILAALAILAFATTPYPLEISKVEVKDFRGEFRRTFKRGETVVVETEIRASPGYYFVDRISYLQIITMWYGDQMVSLTLTRATIAPDEAKTFGGGMGIRQTDPLGTYKIEVYVWNGFPSEKGADFKILAARKEAKFTVVSG